MAVVCAHRVCDADGGQFHQLQGSNLDVHERRAEAGRASDECDARDQLQRGNLDVREDQLQRINLDVGEGRAEVGEAFHK
eukprot:8634677-Karenia_brevis.AAC.1